MKRKAPIPAIFFGMKCFSEHQEGAALADGAQGVDKVDTLPSKVCYSSLSMGCINFL